MLNASQIAFVASWVGHRPFDYASGSYAFGSYAFGFCAFGFYAFGFYAFGFYAFGFYAFGCCDDYDGPYRTST
jgi:hypothetical protein